MWKPGSAIVLRTRLPRLHYGRPLVGYALALAMVAITGMARMQMMADTDYRGPFILFYPAIALTAFLGGVGPGLLTIAAAGLFACMLFPFIPMPISWIVFAVLGPSLAAGFAQIREIREKSKAIAEESLRFRYIGDHVRDWIFLTCESGLIQFVNATACHELGFAGEQLTGRAIESLAPDWQRAGLRTLLNQCRTGKAQPCEIAFECRDGSVVHAEVRCTAVRTKGEVIVHFAARDMTERKLLEQKLREARQWESLRVLAGGVAHDFNNLLTSIMGNASLARQALPEKHQAAGLLEDVERAGNRAAELVRMMLATSGYRPGYNAWLRMDRLLEGIIEDHKIPGHVSVKSTVPAFLFSGDRESIETLLRSLIANAVESYGEMRGEVAVCIRSAAASALPPGSFDEGDAGQKECLAITVEDTGCGMSQEVLERAFDPFFTTKFAGRGLGLPAVRGIVRAYSGRLWLKTVPGEGTRVEVWLPEPAV